MKKGLILSFCFIFVLAIFSITLLNTKTTDIKGSYNRKFKDHVVFYPQHQDDEVLWAGSAIVKALKECGEDNVYVVLVSDGSGVNVFNSMRFKNLSRKEKQNLRDAEFKAALKDLGVKNSNIIILPNIDKKVGSHFELLEKVMLGFENKFNSNVTHIAHHYEYDDHPMHRKNGLVLKNLKDENKIKDCLYFIKPKYIKDVPAKYRVIYTADNKLEYNKIERACNEYKLIDVDNKRFGIGYISAHSYFDHLLKDPKLTSILSIK